MTVEISPTTDGILQAATFANFARIAIDPTTFTIYFFAVPADLPEHPMFSAKSGQPSGHVSVRLPPVAKLVLPAEMVPNVVTALQAGFKQWRTSREALPRVAQAGETNEPS